MKLDLSKRRLAIPIMTHPGIELIGRKVIDAVKSGDVHAEAIIRLSEAMPSDAATVIMDLTVEAEAFGASVSFPDNEVPSVAGRLLKNIGDVKALDIPTLDTARIPEYIKANKLAAGNIKSKPVFAGCIGPFSLAGRLFDMSEIMIAIYTDAELVSILLEKCNAFILSYIRALKATGTSGVIIAEPAAGLLSNADATKFSTEYIRKIVDELQDDNFTIILHNCGNTGHCTKSMIDSGAKALHFGNKCDILEALKETPSDVLVMGNIDPVGVFRNMESKDVYDTTRKLLDSTRDYDNFIISSGCDVPPNVSKKNIEAFYQAVYDFNNG